MTLQPVQDREGRDYIIEHYSAIDETAEVLLTRVTPSGEERWTARLPIRYPTESLADGDHVVLAGLPLGGYDDQKRTQLFSVDLRTGSVATYSYNWE
jgi:hypothetical protein